jgi:hypothetical protein
MTLGLALSLISVRAVAMVQGETTVAPTRSALLELWVSPWALTLIGARQRTPGRRTAKAFDVGCETNGMAGL